jgi:lysophospholipase L1-like esterase
MRKRISLSLVFALTLFLSGALQAQHWVGSWATSQQRPEPQNSLSPDDLRDATLRQIVHLSLGGGQIRVHLSNRFGTVPFYVSAVHVAEAASRASGAIQPETDKALTFSGRADVTIPAGAEYVSDPLVFSASPLSDLAITLHTDAPPAEQTGHPGSRETSFLVHGDLLSAAELVNAQKVEHWYFISGVDVVAAADAHAIVTLGDSITDGHGATTNGNDRWPDVLAKRLQADAGTHHVAVLNHGIGGNRLLLDGLGPNALARFTDDVIAQTAVSYVIILEGINDLGTLTRDRDVPQPEHDTLVRRMIGAYEQMIMRAHAHGIQAIGATILPFVGSGYYHPGQPTEADRQAVNEWIRARGHFDAVIDFDKVTRDPQHPDRLLPAYDSGDHLHPSPAGYAAMAGAVPLSMFAPGEARRKVIRLRRSAGS